MYKQALVPGQEHLLPPPLSSPVARSELDGRQLGREDPEALLARDTLLGELVVGGEVGLREGEVRWGVQQGARR